MSATLRQQIIALLEQAELTVRDLSQALSITEREALGHLPHIAKTITALGKKLLVSASVCLSCGFTFADRQRLGKPSHCPKCRGSHISPPGFRIR